MNFFLPYIYTLNTRYISLGKKFVYLITFIFPELLIFFLQTYGSYKISDFIVISILALTSFVNIYEIGYIYNDTETIKGEIDPTKRLAEQDYFFYEQKKVHIYITRFSISIIINLCLIFFMDITSLICFSVLEIATMVVYWIYNHNHVRGNKTMLFYFFLISFRYLALPICCMSRFTLSVFLAALFVFPLVRTLEYKAHYGKESNVNVFFRKYIIKHDVNKITTYRVLATLFLLILTIVLYFFNIVDFIPVFSCSYIFLYRLFLFVITKVGYKSNDYLKRS